MPIFISYSHNDKEFVNKLATNLIRNKARVWIDRWELNLGDSIINKIQEAIQEASALLIVLSKSSVSSEWCTKELTGGLLRELEEKCVMVFPVLLEDCEIPIFIRGKVYADFRKNFDEGLRTVLDGIAKFTSANVRGRLNENNYYTDWALDWGYLESSFYLGFTLVDHSKKYPYSVLTEIKVTANPIATKRYKQYEKEGLDYYGRLIIIDFLAEGTREINLCMTLKDQFPQEKECDVYDPKIDVGYHLRFICRWLGEDPGKIIILDVGEQFRNIQKQMHTGTPKLSAEENIKVKEIIKKPIEP